MTTSIKWAIQYRKKGSNAMLLRVVYLPFSDKADVKRWFLSAYSTSGKVGDPQRLDYEFINAKKTK